MVRPLHVLLTSLVPAGILIASLFTSLDRDKPAAEDGPATVTSELVASFDGHKVPITVYRPAGASEDRTVPVILHSHGWAGSRQNSTSAFTPYLTAGFGVVSIDMRGHGDARQTSEARVHHVDFEIRDVQAVIDHISGFPWVTLDRPGDPRVGAIGGSYGGAYQLLTAAIDGRLDALVPEITWNDLPQSLVPNGAPKSAWVDLLYGGGNINARLHPSIHQAFTYLQTANRIPDGSVPGTPDLQTQFTQSSAKNYPGAIDVPTLLVQGMPDTLFNFNEAAATYALIRATRAPVALVTHLEGHILNTQGTIPVPAPVPVGLQPAASSSPCGDYDALAVAWFQRHLLNGPAPNVPEVCIALDDGTAIYGKEFPLRGVTHAANFTEGYALAQGAPGPNLTLEAFEADGVTIVAGIPRLSGTVQSVSPDAIVYWSIVVRDGRNGVERIADSQVTPLRVTSDAAQTQSFSIDLGGIGVRLYPGDEVLLRATNTDSQFAHNSERVPGAVILDDLVLELPLVDER